MSLSLLLDHVAIYLRPVRGTFPLGLPLLSLFLIPSANAITLSFDDVLAKALAQSTQLKISKVDIKLGTVDVRSAQVGYLPTLTTRYNTEHLHDFQQGKSSVVSVGGTVIPAGTRFQNAISVGLVQPVSDLPNLHKKVLVAKIEKKRQEVAYEQTTQEVQLKLLDLYSSALSNQLSLFTKAKILALAQKVYEMKRRLHEAGTISRVDLADEALMVAQTLDEMQSLQHKFEQNLADISFYTHEPYTPGDTMLLNLPEEAVLEIQQKINPENSPEVRQLSLALEKKLREIEVNKGRYLPQLSFYMNYNLYGFNSDRWSTSFQNIQNRTISAGLMLMLPTTDLLKVKLDIDKAKLEAEKIALQKQQKIEEIKQLEDTTYREVLNAESERITREESLKLVQNKADMVDRLSVAEVTDQTQPLKLKITLLQQKLNVDLTHLQKLAAQTKLRLLANNP